MKTKLKASFSKSLNIIAYFSHLLLSRKQQLCTGREVFEAGHMTGVRQTCTDCNYMHSIVGIRQGFKFLLKSDISLCPRVRAAEKFKKLTAPFPLS